MKKIVILISILIILIAIASASFYYKKDVFSLFKDSKNFVANDPSVKSIKLDVDMAKDRIFASNTPLRKDETIDIKNTNLTIDGVIKETNAQRALVNLPGLKESKALSRSAEMKVKDMFAKQYFEHISPSGEGPSDLAKKVNYAFVIVGENLALGGFNGDKDLVDSWMASPGHKENILRNGYTEIGVAVRQGLFEGNMVWLAVQEFGTPSSDCPRPDDMLARLLDNNKIELTKQELSINEKKSALDAYNPKNNPKYAAMVGEYNALVETYNTLVSETKLKTGEYNSQAQAYNDCLKKYSESTNK